MYYPKSQIKSDLYTNGGELVFLADEKEYIGYYFSTSDNRFFSGRNPNDKPNFELKLNIIEGQVNEDAEEGNIASYNSETSRYLLPFEYLKNTKLDLSTKAPNAPTQISSLPSENNYKIGEYQRYFLQKNNSTVYIEIDNNQYQSYINQDPNVLFRLYFAFEFPWLVSGNRSEVFNINKNTISRIANNLNLKGFTSYFKNNYTQYFRYQVGENLKTDGTEFLNEKTGKPYIGLYHIHPDKGPMVGAQHVKTPHEYLIPISGSNTDYKINKIETQTNTPTRSIRSSGGY